MAKLSCFHELLMSNALSTNAKIKKCVNKEIPILKECFECWHFVPGVIVGLDTISLNKHPAKRKDGLLTLSVPNQSFVDNWRSGH